MERSNYWQRLAATRLSRRRLLAAGGGAALGGAAAMVVGCGGDGKGRDGPSANSARQTAGPSPIPGGNVTFGHLLNFLGIDPHIDLTGLDVDRLVYSRLYEWDRIKEEIILNDVAEEFEHPDDLTFIFTIRKGIMTHPGDYRGADREITSEDVRQSFNRWGTSITSPDKRLPFKIAGGTDPAKLASALLTPDPYTFRFTMTEPFSPALREIANPGWSIVPASVIEDYGLRLSVTAYGSGPFMLDEFAGDRIVVLRKHPNYFHEGRPYLDTITFDVINRGEGLLEAFESGEHDVNGSVLSKADYDRLGADERFTTRRVPTLFYPVILFKVSRTPFDDPRVLEAIDLSIDRDEIIEKIEDGEGKYNGPIQWPQERWALPQAELRDFYKLDRNRARELLEEAGYGDGFEVDMTIPRVSGATRIIDEARLLKKQLAAVGIDVNIRQAELGTFIAEVILPGNFEMAFFPNLPYDEPDRPLGFYHSRGVTGNGNWTNYTNPQLDRLIDAQSREFDLNERQRLIFEAQRMMLREHGPQITLPSGYEYRAHWAYVHFPYENGAALPADSLPYGCEIWRDSE